MFNSFGGGLRTGPGGGHKVFLGGLVLDVFVGWLSHFVFRCILVQSFGYSILRGGLSLIVGGRGEHPVATFTSEVG